MSGSLRGAVVSIIFCLFAVVALAPTAKADLIYDIGWTGHDGYTMIGESSFDDASGADGRIDGTEVLTLLIEGFHKGASIGSWNLADGQGASAVPFNFNFDPVAEAFFTGGLSYGPSGQQWNALGIPGLGFASASLAQSLFLGGQGVGRIPSDQSTLTATRQVTIAVPEPSTMVMFATGLLGFVMHRRRRCRRDLLVTSLPE